jgi:hypothetical protein
VPAHYTGREPGRHVYKRNLLFLIYFTIKLLFTITSCRGNHVGLQPKKLQYTRHEHVTREHVGHELKGLQCTGREHVGRELKGLQCTRGEHVGRQIKGANLRGSTLLGANMLGVNMYWAQTCRVPT